MAGYRRTRLASGVHDPLGARALVLDDGVMQVALVCLDLVALSWRYMDAARDLIEPACGIPPDRVIGWATHTHTGPITDEKLPTGVPDPEYMRRVVQGMAEAVQKAQGRLTEARLKVGIGHEDRFAFNRRAARRGKPLPPGANELLSLLREGAVPAEPPTASPEWRRAAQLIDPDVAVLYAESVDGSPIATLVNHALHCDTIGGCEYSAGWPHYAYAALQATRGEEMTTLFANGACGDINHIDRENPDQAKGHELAQRIGAAVGSMADAMCTSLKYHEIARIRLARKEMELPVHEISESELAAAHQVLGHRPTGEKRREQYYAEDVVTLAEWPRQVLSEVRGLRLGSAALVALPGEVFVELGLAIKRQSPFETTFVIELANDYWGYIAPRAAFAEGGYEVMKAGTQCLGPGAGEIVVEAALAVLAELYASEGE